MEYLEWRLIPFLSILVVRLLFMGRCLLTIINVYCFLSRAFEQAKKSPGCIFGKTGDIDIEKIKKSKYFQVLLKQSKGKVDNKLVVILYSDKWTSCLCWPVIPNITYAVFSSINLSC